MNDSGADHTGAHRLPAAVNPRQDLPAAQGPGRPLPGAVDPVQLTPSAGSRNATRPSFLPVSRQEMEDRGWEQMDVVFVTGDAYIDHPSFAMALLGRVLEAHGFKVGILSQPAWQSCEPWKTFGRPRLFFAISAGNMDSMINHYTANRKVRNEDAYSPGGQIHRRPDRATLAYCQRAREAYKGVPLIAGGVEASLRRLAHYDYWSDKVRKPIILDAKADLVVYGMGERALAEIVRRLDAGQTIEQLRDIRGTVYRLGASEQPPQSDSVLLPDFEMVSTDPWAFAAMTKTIHQHTDPESAKRLMQYHDAQTVVVNPPSLPLSQAEMDRIFGLPFTRRPHPSYGDRPIPAFAVVKDSVQTVRGCFGGCTFCSLTLHQGRIIQSRSRESILAEIRRMADQPGFSGVVSDIGGPTANMYQMNCSRPEVRNRRRRLSCLTPTICKLLKTDHQPLIDLMKAARGLNGVKRVFIASGVRTDLAQRSEAFIEELVRHHTGGLLKVAPEHSHPDVLELMKKPPIEDFESFEKKFYRAAEAADKRRHLATYFMAGHPGCDLSAMVDLALFLKRSGHQPDKVQDFIPGPMDIATCMYHTGIDPMSGRKVYVPKGDRERRLQRALLQYFKPQNYGDVRQALKQTGRDDLIGSGPDCLISAQPPKRSNRKKPTRKRQR
jgi:uncharacterized radical SAM protein YgiQ